jgi:hypothetical protein
VVAASAASSRARTVLLAVGMLVGLLGFVASLTVLWHSMRSVMEVGRACASGGPYEVRQPCPTGVAATTPLSIFAGIASLGVYVVCAWRLGSTGVRVSTQ